VPQNRGGGCGKAVIIVLAVLLVLGIALSAGAYYVFHWVGKKTSDVVGAGPCQLTSDAVASKGLGTPVTLQKGTGLGGLVSGIIDSRVLADAPSCWGSASVAGSADAGLIVRIALVQGGDTTARFQAEVKQAKGVVVSSSSDGQGGTTTVETGSYYGKAVKGFGDEAFCTTLGGTGTVGVLVRQGDKLLYASVGGTTDPSAGPLVDEDTGCARAQKLAKAVLAG
jgi:hypothetical protein